MAPHHIDCPPRIIQIAFVCQCWKSASHIPVGLGQVIVPKGWGEDNYTNTSILDPTLVLANRSDGTLRDG